ncbi:MerR family transcriptional regulator [Lactiplantibacillus herbarum]|uniref:MerR family transcriptional regulator n=1 Tax=Lactiplantibacillus herbarum TaxID=1670446 RepID=UPI00064F9202|nr:MerR family transcriptional regulator [Lactiplantibacillus herbarum]
MTEQTVASQPTTELVASVAAEQLGIKAVTLRKYSTMVEKQLNDDNRFRPADNSHRLYTPADLETFKTAIDLAEQGTTLATALNQAFNADTKTTTTSTTTAPKSQAATTTAPTTAPKVAAKTDDGPSNAELAKQQEIIIRRLDSLNYRLNLVLERLDEQAKQAPTPWWHFWEK